MEKLIKTDNGYTYKSHYIYKAKVGYLKGFSCVVIKSFHPLTLKEIVAKIDLLENKGE